MKRQVIIILGTAHLETTPGKESPDRRLREPFYSREIVKDIYSILTGYGYTVYIDYMPTEPNARMKGRNADDQQSKELRWRVERVKEICARHNTADCIYVSLHVDAAGMGTKWMTAGGFTVWTSKGQTRGDLLAECIYDAADKNLVNYKRQMEEGKKLGWYDKKQQPMRTDTSDGDRDREADFYVLRKTPCPACLVEMMFQDNEHDVDYLLSEEGQWELVRTIHEGILLYNQRYIEKE